MRLFGRVGFIVLLCLGMALPSVTLGARNEGTKHKNRMGPLKTERMVAKRNHLKWDLKLGPQAYQAMLGGLKEKKIPTDSDTAMTARLRRIMKRLQAKSLMPDLPFELHYVKSPVVNAACYPSGKILVFSGLFDPKNGLINARSDDEIAAVLAHEMAHGTLRHSYRQYRSAQAAQVFGAITSVVVGSAAGTGWSDLFDLVYDVTTGLAFPSYSRRHESEADLEGLYTMMAAGYNPEKAIAVWERAAQHRGKAKHSIFASHPSNMQRAKELRRHVDAMRGGVATK